MTFYLGTHKAHWLGQVDVPLFVSRRTLAHRRTLPRARGPWALDSGGFTELAMHGAWTVPARQYVDEVRRFRDEIGGLTWAPIQDWMCEPGMLRRTGASIADHQRFTVESYAELLHAAPELPWMPVLQGWTADDYLRHAAQYDGWRLPLADRLVGVGTLCRRQRTSEGVAILRGLAVVTGLRLHGFGLKTTGLRRAAGFLESADSMAWSRRARWAGDAQGRNGLAFALAWRERVLAGVDRQLALFVGGAV